MVNPQKFFDDNIRSLGATPQQQCARDGEKYNLYSGLFQLAGQVVQLRSEVAELKQALQAIEHLIRIRS